MTGKIGIAPPTDKVEEVVTQEDRYYHERPKRLTKANSFMVLDEVMYIVKKEPTGKASVLYHTYRVSDLRYVCPSTLSKEDTIKMVRRKYNEQVEI